MTPEMTTSTNAGNREIISQERDHICGGSKATAP